MPTEGAPDEELAFLRHGTRSVVPCVHKPHTLSEERDHRTRHALPTPVAVGARIAPPVELALLGQREGVVMASSHGDNPPPCLRLGFNPPRQDLALQRAMAEPGEPKGKHRAGAGRVNP